jgi:glycosyl transferase family 25
MKKIVLIVILILFILLIKITINKYLEINKEYLFYKNTKVYVINLYHCKDRLELFKNTYNFHNIDYEVISAIDGNKLDINRLHKEQIVGDYVMNTMNKKIRDYHYEINTMGAIGCYLSHIEVWKKIKEDKNCNYGMIFEDDVIINNNITDKVIYEYINDLPNDWDILLLNKNRVVMTREKNNLFKVSKFICTHSYVIKKNSIDKILKELMPINQQIDFKLSCLATLGKINIYLYNNKDKLYKQGITKSNIHNPKDRMEGRSWELNCNI